MIVAYWNEEGTITSLNTKNNQTIIFESEEELYDYYEDSKVVIQIYDNYDCYVYEYLAPNC